MMDDWTKNRLELHEAELAKMDRFKKLIYHWQLNEGMIWADDKGLAEYAKELEEFVRKEVLNEIQSS